MQISNGIISNMRILIVQASHCQSMCRIAGIIHKSFPVVELERMVKTMCNSLIHGGPDDGGIEAMGQEHVVLGNRRLALQDLSAAGHQPMHYRQRYTITYNGELYNFPQLKQELEKEGHYFSNHTDTEVILAAFAQSACPWIDGSPSAP
ncbi:MAG: hypothetical protein EOP49_46100, partial [Sphingobacteriales bacterium]